MADTNNDASVNLIRAFVQNMNGQDDNWESLSMIVESSNGRYNSVHGYAYSPDGTISAVAARPSAVLPYVDAYISSYYKPDEQLPVKFLVQYNRTSGKYTVTFEDTDITRWKVSPATIDTLPEELRPNTSMTNAAQNPQEEIIFTRNIGWMPHIIRKDETLYLEFGAGADANHEPRTFRVPISQAHFEVIQADFARHSLIWAALLPLADAAGTSDPIDESAAVALLDSILLGSEAEVEALLKKVKRYDGHLIAHHADPALLEQDEIFAALKSLTLESDTELAQEYYANRRRVQTGVHLSPLDTAVLKFTNKYLYGGGIPSRNPDAVEPELLPQVLEIIATAEQACAGMELPNDYGTDYARFHQRDKDEWNKIKDTVEEAVRGSYPTLPTEAIETISFLMCAEAASRAKATRKQL